MRKGIHPWQNNNLIIFADGSTGIIKSTLKKKILHFDFFSNLIEHQERFDISKKEKRTIISVALFDVFWKLQK